MRAEINNCYGSRRRKSFSKRLRGERLGREERAYSDVGVLVVPGKIQHVIQSQHAWRDLGEIHRWVDVVLRRRRRRDAGETRGLPPVFRPEDGSQLTMKPSFL